MAYFSGQGRVFIGARDSSGNPQGLTFVGNVNPAPFPSALFWLSEQPLDVFAATLDELGTTYLRYGL